MPFKPGNNANPAGRPRGRIAKFRATLGELTGDGREVAEALLKIIRDPESTKKEIIDASELVLAYLLGKPEQAVSVDGDVNVTAHGRLDMRAVVAALPTELVTTMTRAIDAAEQRALAAGDPDDDEERG